VSVPTLPVLGGEGWTSDPATIMNKIFMHTFLTDYSQSNIYSGHVASLAYLISEYAKNIPRFIDEVERMYERLYKRYFSDVYVNFTQVEDPETGPESAAVPYLLEITASRDGITYDLSKTLRINFNSGVAKFMDAFDADVS
jgi:hypothetical protein